MGDCREKLEAAENTARRLAKHIKENTPRGWGFILMLVSFEEKNVPGGISTYVSNCHPETIPTALREFATMLERRDKQL